MREIKFRAWNIDKKIMCYENEDGDADYWDGAYGSVLQIINSNLNEERYREYTFMQYTGLKDTNGKEIYEGDIITNGDAKIKYIVEWIDCGLVGRQYNNKSYIGLNYWKDTLEVIGNIYENKGLLEE